MNFREAEAYLLSLGNEVLAMKLGLENITKLLAALGNPQNEYLKIQVAGTNGKGSVCAFLESICRQANIRTGLTTSPHLVSMTERVRIDGIDISEVEFARFATKVREVSEDLVNKDELENVPTYFEQVTAIALLAFAEAKVELAILETGLGGRLDATTATEAEVIAITRIDFDHQKILGETLAQIAAEKAAIIRSDSKVVVGDQFPEAMAVIERVCADAGVAPAFASDLQTDSLEGINLGLAGRHQIENAKVAILLAEALRKYFDIDPDSISIGLENARHPGRLEFHGRFLLDGAHNVGGAKALREFLDENIDRPITMIFGTMKDKEIYEISSLLFPAATEMILTKPESPRSAEPSEIRTTLNDNFLGRPHMSESVAEALQLAEQISPPNGIIVVTGSLYLVGEAKKLLDSQI